MPFPNLLRKDKWVAAKQNAENVKAAHREAVAAEEARRIASIAADVEEQAKKREEMQAQEALARRIAEDQRNLRLAKLAAEARVTEAREAQKRKDLERNTHMRREAMLQSATPEALQRLLGLIRLRFQLDVEIWSEPNRGARPAVQPDVQILMRRSVEVLREIRDLIASWETRQEGMWASNAEWQMAHDIFTRMKMQNKIDWSKAGPWDVRTSPTGKGIDWKTILI